MKLSKSLLFLAIAGTAVLLIVIALFTRHDDAIEALPDVPADTLLAHFQNSQLSLKHDSLRARVQQLANQQDSTRLHALIEGNRGGIRSLFFTSLETIARDELISQTPAPARYDSLQLLATVYDARYDQTAFQHRLQFYRDASFEKKEQALRAAYFIDEANRRFKPTSYAVALQYYQFAHTIAGEIDLIQESAFALYRAGLAAYYGGVQNQAAEIQQEASNEADKAGSNYLQLRTQLYLGMAYYDLRLFDKAWAPLQDARNLAKQYRNYALLVRARTRLAGIILYSKSSMAAVVELNDCIELGIKHNVKRELVGAYRYLGFAYRNLGDYDAALEAMEKSTELARELADANPGIWLPHYAAGLTNIGNLFMQGIGDQQQGMTYLRRAKTVADSAYVQKKTKAQIYDNLAYGYLHEGKRDSAIAIAEEAIALFSGSDDVNEASICYSLLAEVFLQSKEFGEAHALINRSLELGQEGLARNSASSWTIKGSIFRQQGYADSAIACYQKAAQIIEDIDTENLEWQIAYGEAKAHQALGDDQAALKAYKLAIDKVEQTRGNIERESFQLAFWAAKQKAFDDIIQLLIEKFNDEKLALHYAERSRVRSFLDLLQGGVELRLVGNTLDDNEKHIESFLKKQSAPADPFAIMEQLAPDDRIIAYRVLDDQLYIWQIGGGTTQFEQVAISSDSLAAKIARFRKLIGADENEQFKKLPYRQQQRWHDRAMLVGAELAEILLPNLLNDLSSENHLYIVADRMLHYLPFAALPMTTGDETEFLIERVPIASVPGLAALSLLLEEQKEAPPAREQPVLAVADPLGDLESARVTVDSLKAHYQTITSLTGTDACKDSVINMLRQPFALIHFGTHCTIDPAVPLNSHLSLASCDKAEVALTRAAYRNVGNAGQPLRMHEVLPLKLQHTSLVVLSACETALGRHYRGEGVMNLSRTFIAAGVPSVIASLWKIDDRSTADLMQQFYRILSQTNRSPAAALRDAQLATIKTMRQNAFYQRPDGRSYPFPYFWAAFVASGASF